MIVGIGGRKGSGKTTLCKNMLAPKGYKKVSFADYLKHSCAELYDINVDSFYDNSLKEKLFEEPLIWDAQACNKLSDIINEYLTCENPMRFVNRRHLLQYIGTDVLRKLDVNFHIKKTEKILQENENSYLDDVRFPNEKALIDRMNGKNVFIIRPYNEDISNHASEISLSWIDYDNIIVNDDTLEVLYDKFNTFTKTNDKIDVLNPTQYNGLFNKIDAQSAYWAGAMTSVIDTNNSIIEFQYPYKKYVMHFAKSIGSSNPILMKKNKNDKRIWYIELSSPFLVEDLKLWKDFENNIKDLVDNNNRVYYLSKYIKGAFDTYRYRTLY